MSKQKLLRELQELLNELYEPAFKRPKDNSERELKK